MPDWFVATATRKPLWFRRAIASIEPGIGRHSAGDLMYWSLSKLMTSLTLLSLRDDDDTEFALVRDPGELDAASRLVLEEALVAAGFVFEVTRVTAIDEEVEIRHWQVETRQGPRTFQTRLDEWPRQLPQGGFLIRDVAGDLYHLPQPAGLDRGSRALLWAFVD